MRAPEFWRGDGGVWPALLAPLAHAYGAAGAARHALTEPVKASVPVICVGNLVTGGAGKTPVALALGAYLKALGKEVHFLTRGYGGSERGPVRVDPGRHGVAEIGDEALLLAARAPTWVARNRVGGAEAAAEDGAGIVVMDDGFQNPSLAKDVSLLVVDGGFGFGNGRVIPAGPLREPVETGLGRASAVVLIGEDSSGVEERIAMARARLGRTPPVLGARLAPGANAGEIAGRPVVAFAGIGRPEKFFATLEEIGCPLSATHAFDDHHLYTSDEVMAICEQARELDALPVTTGKDYVRLPEAARPMVKVLGVELQWSDEAALGAVLAPLLGDG
ncbi:MAG: tetraacyldisaccharide 4'-kinase [Proteobacteria bacterium]|nr:tetraacyldisaccharide 4'-kinase [Pseudomonadota bacterium]